MTGNRIITAILLFVISSVILGQQGKTGAGIRPMAGTDTLDFNYRVVPVRLNGPSGNRVNIGYAGDGYTNDEMESFPPQVDKSVYYIESGMQSVRPYSRYRNFFNIYLVEVASEESGISIAPGFGEEPTLIVKNALGGTRDNDRLGWVDRRLAASLFNQAEAELENARFNWKFVVLNNPAYHNSGGRYVVFSYNFAREIALHEAGHGFHDLADEYYGKGEYARDEPRQVNVTADSTGAKWAHWMGYVDSDTLLGTIDVYEGAIYASKGAYRPSLNSKMGWTSDRKPASFNAICREKIILDIYDIVDPFDSFSDTLTVYSSTSGIRVAVIDSDVIKVDWYIDGELVATDAGGIFPASIRPGMGFHTVTAHIYDEVIRHAFSDNNNPHPLDLVRKDLDKLQCRLTWKVEIADN